MGALDRLLRLLDVGKSVRKVDHVHQILEGILAFREQYNRIKEIEKLVPEIKDDEVALLAISDGLGMAAMVSELFDVLGVGAITKEDMISVLQTLANTYGIMSDFANLERSIREDRTEEEDKVLARSAARYNARVGVLKYATEILGSMTFRDADVPPLRRGIRAALDEKERWEAFMRLARMGDEIWTQYHVTSKGLVTGV